MKTGSKLCPLECAHGFTKIQPSDLVFLPNMTVFNYGLDFITINILTKFHLIKTTPSRVYIWFFLELTLRPSF